MMQINVDLVQLVVLPISLNLKKNPIINVLDKNIFIFVLIDRQLKKLWLSNYNDCLALYSFLNTCIKIVGIQH